MTTQGGLGYRDLIQMEEKELLYWYQKCVDFNEEQESKTNKGRRR